MKTLQVRLRGAARAQGVLQLVVERDYAQSYVLLGIATSQALREHLVFKGGTALKKVHFRDYRFSEDLDFSLAGGPRGADLEEALRLAIAEAESAARIFAPLKFTVERYEERVPHPGGQEAFAVRVQFPWQREPMVPVLLELTVDEPVLLPAPPIPIAHGYDEPFEAYVRTYTLEEIAAEKLRSTRQTLLKLEARGWARSRARDYYDLWRLTDVPALDWPKVVEILPPPATAQGAPRRRPMK